MNENQISNTPLNYWQDTVECWRRLPNKGFFLALLAAWLALFQFLGNSILGYIHTPSLFLWMHEAYRSSSTSANDDAHGNIIPFLVIGLFWWKRKDLLALRLTVWWPGLLMLLAAMALHILGYVLQQPRISILALFLGIYGLMGLAWGREWLRKSLFPFCLFAFSIPLGDQGKFITVPLQLLATWLTAAVAHLMGIGVVRNGVVLTDPTGTYQYEVAAACSGIRSLIAIFLLATAYGFTVFRSPRKRLLLMTLAFPFAVIGNLMRMLFIIVAAEMGGQPWGDYIHESGLFALVPYVPAMAGLLLVGHWLENRPRSGSINQRPLP